MSQLLTEPTTTTTPTPATGPVRPNRGPFPGAARLLQGIPHVFLVAWAIMVALPIGWILVSSLKTNPEIYNNPFGLPGEFRPWIYAEAWQTSNIGSFFLNTVIVVCGGVLLTMLLSAMTAYVFAKYPFTGSRAIYYLYLAGLTFPVFLAIVPLVKIAQLTGTFGNRPGLILIYTAFSLPFSIFFLTSFFQSLPRELAEAAFIDGAGHFGTFFMIMLPLARPGLISIGVFNFLGQWNQYLLPVVLNPPTDGENSNFVLTQGLADLALRQNYETSPTSVAQLFAGLVIAMIPVLAVYIVFQRQVQEGLTAGALK
ncbi:carbohydrate ABC transporter permease [Microlunatus sp. Y2014]|uniref:carbohydrate ABC transporter permease n=1 Tax=Microlunatus sp. Y2014 TaxID=3418488 RepID=UPI003DA6F5C1